VKGIAGRENSELYGLALKNVEKNTGGEEKINVWPGKPQFSLVQ